jgi:hypothetical protein
MRWQCRGLAGVVAACLVFRKKKWPKNGYQVLYRVTRNTNRVTQKEQHPHRRNTEMFSFHSIMYFYRCVSRWFTFNYLFLLIHILYILIRSLSILYCVPYLDLFSTIFTSSSSREHFFKSYFTEILSNGYSSAVFYLFFIFFIFMFFQIQFDSMFLQRGFLFRSSIFALLCLLINCF